MARTEFEKIVDEEMRRQAMDIHDALTAHTGASESELFAAGIASVYTASVSTVFHALEKAGFLHFD